MTYQRIGSEQILRDLGEMAPGLRWIVDLSASRHDDEPYALALQVSAFDLRDKSVHTWGAMVAFAMIDNFTGDLEPIRAQFAVRRGCVCIDCRDARKAEAA